MSFRESESYYTADNGLKIHNFAEIITTQSMNLLFLVSKVNFKQIFLKKFNGLYKQHIQGDFQAIETSLAKVCYPHDLNTKRTTDVFIQGSPALAGNHLRFRLQTKHTRRSR